MNILLSSVGRRVELVRLFQRAYRHLGLEGRLWGTDVDWLAPGLHVVDCPVLVPRCQDEHYLNVMLRVCQQHQIRLVIPLIDPEIPVLAAARSSFQAVGTECLVPDPQGAAMAGDKWQTYQFFCRLGIRAPQAWLPNDLQNIEPGYPCVVKPRRGSAGDGVVRVADHRELELALRQVQDPIIQTFVSGPEITSDVICDFDGAPVQVVSRQRLAVRGGEAMKSVTIDHGPIRDTCQKIARAFPGHGPITVQCMLDKDGPTFIEINARVGGGLPLAVAAGVDVPALLLSLAAGRSIEAYRAIPAEPGWYMTRCDESIFVREDVREQLARCDF